MSEFLKPQSPLQHSDGTYIYPLTTADQIIMGDGSRLSAKLENLDASTLSEHLAEDNTLDLVYPVGAIYLSVDATSPASLFGGTWEQILDGDNQAHNNMLPYLTVYMWKRTA